MINEEYEKPLHEIDRAEEMTSHFPMFVRDKTNWTFNENWVDIASDLEEAILMAVMSHACQRDKNGSPYILHCLRVMMRGQTDDERMVGVLHDILEDTDTEARDLVIAEIPFHIVEAIVALSHDSDNNEPREQYYDRIKANPLAYVVKGYDLDDNTSPERLALINEEDKPRLIKKYRKAYKYLYGFIPEHLNE